MNIDFETANMLDDSVRRYAEDKYNFLDRHRVLTQPAGYSEAAWRDYAAFGWLALRLPEDAGGLDADVFAVAALMETVGARLLMEPVLASAIVGTELLRRLGSDAQRAELLPRLADGSLKLAYAQGAPLRVSDGRVSGAAEAILHGDIADLILVSAVDDAAGAAPQVYLVDPAATGVSRTAFRLVDDRGAANMRFDQARAAPRRRRRGCRRGDRRRARPGHRRPMRGSARHRAQAGRHHGRLPEGPQPVRQAHRHQPGLAAPRRRHVFLSQEIAALTVDAKHAMALPAAGRAGRISGAKAYIVQAARKVANEAVQMHGGLGLTEELDVSHYFRRLMVGAALFGDREQQFARFLSVS